MRNKRLIVTIAVLLLTVFVLSLTLIACKEKVKEEEKPPIESGEPFVPPIFIDDKKEIPPQAATFQDAMSYFIESMPSEYMSLNFEGYVVVSGKKYKMALKGNVSDDDLQLSVTFKDDVTGKIASAIYIVNSRLFIQSGDGEERVIYNIAEIDVNYLLSIIDKLPDKIAELLSGISLGDLNLSIPSIVEFALGTLLGGLSPQDDIVYEEENGVEKFQFTLDVQGMLNPITELLAPGTFIGSLLPSNLDLSFVSTLLSMVPPINGSLNATVDNGVLTEFNLELLNNDPTSENYKQTLLGLDSAITFGSQPIELEIPDELENYETLTLGNLNVDLSLSLNTGDEPVDIGAYIDMFLDAPMFGSGLFMLDAHADYRLDIKASLDPDLFGSKTDNNFVNIMFFSGEHELVRANYLDGYLYVKALANGVNGFAEGGINVAIKLPLKDYIAQLVELITGYIDGFLGTQFQGGATPTAVLSASITRDGDMILSPSLQDVITGVMSLLNLDKCIEMEGGDHITVLINQDLFDAISALIGKEINYPIFGDLTIGLFKGGIEYIEIRALDFLTFRADNFGIGKAKIDREYVMESIGNKDNYGTDVESVILNSALSLLGDLDVSIAVDVSTVNTTVNLTPIVNSILAVANNRTYLNLPITLDMSKYDGIFKIRIASSYDEDTRDGRLLFEIITPDGDILISAYSENSNTYVDLSGLGLMQFCLTNLDLSKTIRSMLGDVEIFNDDLLGEAGDIFMSSGLEIDSDSIGVAVDSFFLSKILRILSMDLGLEAGLKASLDFDGNVIAELDLGELVKLGLRISLGKESESSERIADKIAACEINEEYHEYNTLGAEVLVDSILDALNLNLIIDIYNNNVDKPTHENKTRIAISRSKAVTPGTSVSVDGVIDAPYGAIVVVLYDGWTTNEDNAMVYVVLDVKAGLMSLKICKPALSGISAVNLVNWILGFVEEQLKNIKVDIRTMLVGMLSGLFTENNYSGSTGGAIEVPGDALPAQKPVVDTSEEEEEEEEETTTEEESTPITLDQILSGVVVTLTGSMDLDIDVNFNGPSVSNLLTGMLTDLFSDLNLSEIMEDAAYEHVSVKYDNKNKGIFIGELYNNIVKPLIKKKATALVSSLLDTMNGNDLVGNLVNRFLPLSDVASLTANISVTDGKLANISIIGDNGGQDKQGYGIYIFNKKADAVVSFEHQATNIYYNRTFGDNLMDRFETRARKHTNKNWEEDSWDTIVWSTTVGHETLSLEQFNSRLGEFADGEYVFTGTAWAQTITVNVTIDSSEIQYIKDFEVKAMRDVPSYVTAVFGQDAEGNDIERLLTNVNINTPLGRVNAEENASVTIGGKEYKFTIYFEDEEISVDTLLLNAYDYLDTINALDEAGSIRVKVNDAFYRNLPATYYWEDIYTGRQLKDITRTEAQDPAEYHIRVHVGEGTEYEQDMVMTVQFKPFDIYSIERNGLNYIETDFIEMAYGQSFPSEITVVGYNGVDWLKYTAEIEWDLSSVEVDLKGGQYFVSAVINKGKYNEWQLKGIEVNVLSSDIVDLAPSSKTTVLDWKYCIYGGVSMEQCITSLLNFKASDGTIKTNIPVTIDISGIYDSEAFGYAMAGYEYRIDCPVSIDVKGLDGKPLFETTITVIVPSVKMSLFEDEITIDVTDKDFKGLDAYFTALSYMEIMLGDDIVTANLSWATDDVIVNKDGEYKVRVYLDRYGNYPQYCDVTVHIVGNNNATNEEV